MTKPESHPERVAAYILQGSRPKPGQVFTIAGRTFIATKDGLTCVAASTEAPAA